MRSKIKGTDHQELIDRLIAAGWSSLSISLYMKTRYGHDVHDSTVRVYRLENEDRIREEYPDLVAAQEQYVFKEKHRNHQETLDVIGELQQLVWLQKNRIMLDVKHEEQMGKLFASTRHEIKTLADLFGQYHEVLQDWGVAPKAGDEVTVHVDPAPAMNALSLHEMVETEEDMDKVIEFSRFIGRQMKQLPNGSNGGSASNGNHG